MDLARALIHRQDIELKIGVMGELNLYSELTANLPIEQLPFEPFSVRRRNSSAAYSALLERFRPDVIHTHLFLAEFLSSYHVLPDVAYVCHGHDNMVQFARPSWHSFVASRDARTYFVERSHLMHAKYRKVATAFVANSTHTLAYYRRVLPSRMAKEAILLPYGFDFARFYRARSVAPAQDGRLRLVNVGSFQPKKNQALIVEIAKELARRGVDFEITLLGDGELRSTVEFAVQAAGLAGYIRFLGNVDNVERWLGESHVYLHTARYEPFGLVFLEAMAAGLPCVTLDGQGNRDLIEDGLNGFLIMDEEPAAFADRILETIAEPDRYLEMSKRAQRFASRYEIEASADRFVDLYRARVDSARGGER